MTDTTMLDAALDYAATYNWLVFPVKRNKTPLTEHGFYNATTDPEQISAWYNNGVRRGIGLATGKQSGVVALDVDMKDGKNGEASLAALEAQHSALPTTVSACTGSGGRHIYFKQPDNITIATNCGFAKLG